MALRYSSSSGKLSKASSENKDYKRTTHTDFWHVVGLFLESLFAVCQSPYICFQNQWDGWKLTLDVRRTLSFCLLVDCCEIVFHLHWTISLFPSKDAKSRSLAEKQSAVVKRFFTERNRLIRNRRILFLLWHLCSYFENEFLGYFYKWMVYNSHNHDS